MQPDIEQMLRPELRPGEKLLWVGQPRSGVRFWRADIIFVPFTLAWSWFAILLELDFIQRGESLLFQLWSIPLVLWGLYFVVGRLFHDAWRRARTYYGLTNERILIISETFQRKVQSFALKELSEMNLIGRNDRSGTIMFGPVSHIDRILPGPYGLNRGMPLPPRFELIENAQQIYMQIQTAQRALLAVGA